MLPAQQECQKKRSTAFMCIYLFIIGLATIDARGEIIKAHEPKYSEAVLAYNSKNYKEALHLLNELLVEAPGLIEFLELKALVLKTAKDDVESAKTYQEIIKSKQAAGAPNKELAPYYFELGVIRFQQKSFERAEDYLNFAAGQNYNAGAAHFFMGMITFQGGRYSESETHFQAVVKSQIDDLKPASQFYLGQVYMKNGYPGGATASFNNAKTSANEIIADKNAGPSSKEMAKEIRNAVDKILGPMDQSRWFSSASLMLGQDSNVQALPNSASDSQTLGKASKKIMLQAGIGYMSSPVRTYQIVPNYRLMYNYNTNRLSREGEFLTQIISVYLNRKPLDSTGVGLKADATHTFQNQFEDGSTTQSTYRPYSLGFSFGPYIRTEVFNRWMGMFEISGGPQNFNGDDKVADSEKRGGTLIQARASLSRQSNTRFFNPTFGVSYTKTETKGTEYDSAGYSLSLNNGFNFGEKTKASLGVSYSPTSYDKRATGTRNDKNLTLNGTLSYVLNTKWTLLSDGSYTKNTSNFPDIYQYNRYTFSVGASYTFF